jgi:glycosyltransferase involved in cell wall biosynthesis
MNNQYVSVILPVFNAEKYLVETIESILSQDYNFFELIILDDGSTDSSLKIIKEYTLKDNRIKFITRENRGLAKTLNELIELSQYDYIFRMDADDICYQDRITNQLNFLKINPDVIMLGGQIDFILNNSRVEAFNMPISHEEIKKGLMRGQFPICHPAIVFKKEKAIQAGKYLEDGPGEDLDFFLRMTEIGKVSNIAKKVLSYRIGLDSLSMRHRDSLNQAYSYAIYNASRRNLNKDELNREEYKLEIWEKRNFLRLSYKFKDYGEFYYRNFIMNRKCNKVKAFSYLFLAAIFKPKIALIRIIESLKQAIQ